MKKKRHKIQGTKGNIHSKYISKGMDKDVYKRRKSQSISTKVTLTGPVRKFDSGLVIAGHRLAINYFGKK